MNRPRYRVRVAGYADRVQGTRYRVRTPGGLGSGGFRCRVRKDATVGAQARGVMGKGA